MKDLIKIDIMMGDRYYLTFRYRHPRIFVLRMEELVRYAEEHYPSIRGKNYRLVPYE